ncbi:unnamed protein product [Protopolystoma xenopodis]|uniref:Uncharacterized protein n=1 Tax=Protopolystoma xenopodis TaxID=117903 RepID=A0A448XHZ4_9PLAT|nr:unnamed protein product [Protopolystoma xenopodis]
MYLIQLKGYLAEAEGYSSDPGEELEPTDVFQLSVGRRTSTDSSDTGCCLTPPPPSLPISYSSSSNQMHLTDHSRQSSMEQNQRKNQQHQLLHLTHCHRSKDMVYRTHQGSTASPDACGNSGKGMQLGNDTSFLVRPEVTAASGLLSSTDSGSLNNRRFFQQSGFTDSAVAHPIG